MDTITRYVERRSVNRLRDTPLRRRIVSDPPAQGGERRECMQTEYDVASELERNIERYPTQRAMLTYIDDLPYAARAAYFPSVLHSRALERAADVIKLSRGVPEAVATLHGYQAFMARQNAWPTVDFVA